MNGPWINLISSARDSLGKRFLIASGAGLGLVLATGSAIQAQTAYPVNGTAGFETGLQKLATVDSIVEPTVDWGDGNTTNCPAVGKVSDGCGLAFGGPIGMDVYGTHRYVLPGQYTISVSYTPFIFVSKTVKTTATITPSGSFVILSIGDSIASGEGNPIVPANVLNQPNWGLWDDPYSSYLNSPLPTDELAEWPQMSTPCHRSRFAGQVQAMAMVQRNNPAVSFGNYACSGATISPGDTPTPGAQDAVGQLRVARGRLPRIDVLIISAGANSLYGPNSFGEGFAGLVTYCLGEQLDPRTAHHCASNPDVATDLDRSFNVLLPNEYAKLAQEINCIDPASGTPDASCTDPQKQIPKLVLITEVMDPTHDAQGQYPILGQCPAGFDLVGEYEWQFFHDSIVAPLNQLIDRFYGPTRAAGLAAPTYTVGIADDFRDHGICAGTQRWVNDIGDSLNLLGLTSPHNAADRGTAHPNSAAAAADLHNVFQPDCGANCGHEDYRDRIYSAIVTYNPPVTSLSGQAGGATYNFGTWIDKDVVVTLSADNAVKEAGLGATLYAIDNLNCIRWDASSCATYTGPFTISESGKHTLTFFSQNASKNPEGVQTAQVWVDKNPPLSSMPPFQSIPKGGAAPYTITLGHTGWTNPTIRLSCSTDLALAQCSMNPTSVTLDASISNTSVATVVSSLGQVGLVVPREGGPNPWQPPLTELRLLLALAAAAFLLATARELRAGRWVPVRHFAGLAFLCGLLCAGCNSGAQAPLAPRSANTVTITATDGTVTNTVQVGLFVQ